jgi:hypothetical protein
VRVLRSDVTRCIALLLALAACEIEEVAIPRTEAQLAMHSVLSASAPTQVVLLERTRNGSVALVLPPFDLADPIGSDEGIAERGALASLTTPSGETLSAQEEQSGGIYRFALPGSALERGGKYSLFVLTTKGEALRAETSVPAGTVAEVAVPRVFDRARDTVVIEWPAAAGARSYFVRIETPFGPRAFFTSDTRVRLTGDLRNIEVAGLPRVFIPGFPQAVTVSAVDSNYYDWYRTHNDALSGRGLVNRVEGGLGVFGAIVRLRFEDFRVVAPQSEPEAGTFRFTGSEAEVAAARYLSLELYVESRAARDDQADALSGRYAKRLRIGEAGCGTCGLLGTTRGGRIELALLSHWYANDTLDVLTGEIRGDTIVGTYRVQGGIARFVRQR